MGCALEERQLYAGLLLAQFTAPFSADLAAEILGMAGREAAARGHLVALTSAGLLTSYGGSAGQTWSMHACVRDAMADMAQELGISHLAAK